jgi:hypothetical protein
LAGFDHLLDQRADLDALQIEGDPSRLDLLDVENVVDQANEPLAVGVSDGGQPQDGIRTKSRPEPRSAHVSNYAQLLSKRLGTRSTYRDCLK